MQIKSVLIFSLAIGAGLFFLACNNKIPKTLSNGYQLVYAESFDKESAFAGFEFADPATWKYSTESGKGGSLECFGKSAYEPAVRSPFYISLITAKQFGSFVLEADLQQTGRVYNHQDMCVFFGFQDPSHFYYTHISKAMDDHANNVFIVNNEPRIKISTKTNDGQNWQPNQWHKIRLERNVESGSIRLFFDDMTQPVMEAQDKTFGAGGIGFGSFDDSGKVDNIRIWSKDPVTAGKPHF